MSGRPRNPDVTVAESRLRIERLVATARLLFATSAIALALAGVNASRLDAGTLQLSVAYGVFSVAVLAIVHAAPRYPIAADVVTHVVDVAWAAAMLLAMAGSGTPVVVLFGLPLFAAAARWGLAPTMATAAVAAVLYVGVSVNVAPQDAKAAAGLRAATLGVPALALAWLLGALASMHGSFRRETSAAARLLAEVNGSAPFNDSLRAFVDACMDAVQSSHAVLALELLSAQGQYLWRASRDDSRQTTMALGELTAEEHRLYLTPAVCDPLIWHAWRTRRGNLAARVLQAGALSQPARMEAGYAAPLLDWHGISSVAAIDAGMHGEWRARLILLAPARVSTGDFYLLRGLAARVGPALYHKYLVRRVRSRAGATARARLARELHDSLLQSLIGLEMDVDVLRRQALATPVPEARLREIQNTLRQNIADVRDSMLQLRVTEMTSVDVLHVIAVLVDRLRRECGLDVQIASTISHLDCTPRTAMHLARIVQEALSNVRKHSGARTVTLTLAQHEDAGRLVIEDDGRGFRFKGRLTLEQLEATDLGPAVIKERVRAMGGRLTIESRPGEGVRLELEWPRAALVYGQGTPQASLSI